MTLHELINNKKADLRYIDGSASVLDAIKSMHEGKIGSLLIQSEEGKLAGIVTERDILRFCSSRHGDVELVQVADIMTRNPVSAPPDCSNEEAMTLMTERRFRHLPIVEDGKTLGMVSIGDLVKARLQDVTVEVKYLREYLSA
ncbi:MAG: CBS domain-containing protein [Gammaproteobacteria bacterium]|nr:CBS domain-containing protein [Gammaproteobacteria bacterium]MCB1851660.1 CBS domain-containing protein [Gammaproteobacteria bacterium]MCP5417280.1 CBS domain-containing protein [Chromatiaceae bacterium]